MLQSSYVTILKDLTHEWWRPHIHTDHCFSNGSSCLILVKEKMEMDQWPRSWDSLEEINGWFSSCHIWLFRGSDFCSHTSIKLGGKIISRRNIKVCYSLFSSSIYFFHSTGLRLKIGVQWSERIPQPFVSKHLIWSHSSQTRGENFWQIRKNEKVRKFISVEISLGQFSQAK